MILSSSHVCGWPGLSLRSASPAFQSSHGREFRLGSKLRELFWKTALALARDNFDICITYFKTYCLLGPNLKHGKDFI